MSHCRWMAAVIFLIAVNPLKAQLILVPAPPPGWGPVHRGVVVIYQKRIVVAQPPPILLPRSYEYDLSGIDLDVEPAEKLDPRWPNVPRAPKREPAPPHKPMPPADDNAPPKPKAPPPKAPPPPKEKDHPNLDEPRADPADEARRLVELGLIAFVNQEYGLAAVRFRQATEFDPAASRGYFLLGQAYFALGKYKEATQLIEEGMRREPNWPLAPFRPRVELYNANDAGWLAHKKQLEDVVEQLPAQPAYLFLLAHQLWFDGMRDEAARMFRRARRVAVDPTMIDRFLDFAPPGAVSRRP
ncbi:MAG: tetratricopeptide repeat protein [Planctomycetes bacterium]|nr:tetratricopeptide repeat protein [Planctomycetota bacterium]